MDVARELPGQNGETEMISIENRNHRPMTSLCEDELLRTIRQQWQDAGQARAELISRGWSSANIEGML